MVRYRDQMTLLTSRPLPPKSLSDRQKRTAIAQQVKDVANAYAGCARELHRLTPPAEFAETHAASENFFTVMADDNYRWAEAILHGNRATRARLEKEANAKELKAAQHLQTAMNRAGVKAKEMDALISELQQK
jgi:hypothetical protein